MGIVEAVPLEPAEEPLVDPSLLADVLVALSVVEVAATWLSPPP